MDLLYFISPENRDTQRIKELLDKHRNIKFVSLVAVDLGNNHTDEKIPIEIMKEDIENFLLHGVQTDGSSVYLPEIAEINDAKVDIIPDLDVKWLVDYNFNNIDPETNLPIGTLIIPSFLVHNGQFVCSRSILKNAMKYIKDEIKILLKENKHLLREFDIENHEDIDDIVLTTATELEFWVQTPGDKADVQTLSTSQTLKEQYWKRTVGPVRTALEQALLTLDKYGYVPEMGHKEVGGIPYSLTENGEYTHIMEQLEIDWKFSNPMQASDNELFARDFIKDIFIDNGLDVTFQAKPIEGVAGSGKHLHIGIAAKKKDGTLINLFSPKNMKKEYMSSIGWGALMGFLKNYEVINPFISSTNDALNRLKPGFEAPVCIVASIGHKVDTPSRNRSVLIGLIRDLNNPYATRFEIRSLNPFTNTYLATAAIYQGMLDGIEAVAKANKTYEELEKELSKAPGEESFYLERDRAYRSEDDVFEDYSEEERNILFGKPPATVWENIKALNIYEDKAKILKRGNVFTDRLIESFKRSVLMHWATELKDRIIPNNMALVRDCKKLHGSSSVTDLDVVNWEKINHLRYYLMKDSLTEKSLFTRVREAIENKDYELASNLQKEMNEKIQLLKTLYIEYKRNLIDLD